MQEVTDFIDKDKIIKQISLFSELNWLESQVVLPKLAFFEYKKNEIIYNEGDPPCAFYLLVYGRIQLSTKLASGEEKTSEYFIRGKYFGIISLLTGEHHSATAGVINDSLILKIGKSDFDDILKRIPRLAVNMSKALSQRLRRKHFQHKEIFETKIISVCSAVSRVGKSMYATNLSFSLKKETNKQVIFVEMNPQRSVISDELNIKMKAPPINITEPSFDENKIKESVLTHPDNIDLLCILCNHGGKKKQTNIIYLLGMLMKDYHYIIIDLPLSPDQIVYQTLKQSDLIHIVTDGKKQNLNLTGTFIEKLKNSIKGIDENISVIINEIESKKTKLSSDKKRKRLGQKIYATTPHFTDSRIEKARFMVVLEYPNTEYTRAIRRIAREIGEALVGLALGGGAAFGLAHIGVLKVLEEEGIGIDVVSGTSMGAFMGALWVSGLSAQEIERVALRFQNKFRVFRIFDFTFPRRGLISGKYVTRVLKKHLKAKTFQDLKMPFRVTACDLETRQEVIFDEGDLAKAVRASISIPGIFTPLFDKGRFLVDGGILEPVPVQTLIKMGVSKIISVNTLPSQLDIERGYQRNREEQEKQAQIIRKSNLFKRFFYWLKNKISHMFLPNILDAIVNALQASESGLAEVSCKQSDVYIHPDLSGIKWFEFYRVEELIKLGEKEARRLLPQIKRMLTN